MLAGALLILLPLFLGFAVPLNNRTVMTAVHHSVDGLVYFILALLGVGLGQMEGLGLQLAAMAAQVGVLVTGLLVLNLAGLWLWHRWQPMYVETVTASGATSYRRLFLAAAKPLAAVMAGLLAGWFLLPALGWVEDLATWALMLFPRSQFAVGGGTAFPGVAGAAVPVPGTGGRVWLVFAVWYRDR